MTNWDYAGKEPVLRIPVAGPEPFNTLAVIRGGALWETKAPWPDDGDIHRWLATAKTPFILQGFDQRVDPVFDHSTTVIWELLNLADDSEFVFAEDAVVEGRFDEEGRWEVTTLVAAGAGEPARAQAFVSSWVLCYESRPPDRPPKPHPGAITIVAERQPYADALALTREKHPDRGVQRLRPRKRGCESEDERRSPGARARPTRDLEHLSPPNGLTAEFLEARSPAPGREPCDP